MARVSVYTSITSANVSNEIQPHSHETVHAVVAADAAHLHPLERHQLSQNDSVRNATEVWKGQLSKSLSRYKELLVNPPVQPDVEVATPRRTQALAQLLPAERLAMPQVVTLTQPPDAAIVATAARATNGAASTAIIPIVMSISDIIIPGLGMTISAVLAAIKKLCERLLKRKQERLVRISKRLTDLYELAKKMETQHRFLPSEWLECYRDLVGRFQTFMVGCEERHVVMRIVNGGRENREVRAFEERVDSLYGSMEFQERGGGGCCVQ